MEKLWEPWWISYTISYTTNSLWSPFPVDERIYGEFNIIIFITILYSQVIQWPSFQFTYIDCCSSPLFCPRSVEPLKLSQWSLWSPRSFNRSVDPGTGADCFSVMSLWKGDYTLGLYLFVTFTWYRSTFKLFKTIRKDNVWTFGNDFAFSKFLKRELNLKILHYHKS